MMETTNNRDNQQRTSTGAPVQRGQGIMRGALICGIFACVEVGVGYIIGPDIRGWSGQKACELLWNLSTLMGFAAAILGIVGWVFNRDLLIHGIIAIVMGVIGMLLAPIINGPYESPSSNKTESTSTGASLFSTDTEKPSTEDEGPDMPYSTEDSYQEAAEDDYAPVDVSDDYGNFSGTVMYSGNFSNGNTQWPVTLKVTYSHGQVQSATYHNVKYKATLRMDVLNSDPEQLVLTSKDLDLQLSGGTPPRSCLTGIAISGDTGLDVTLWPS